MFKRRSDIEITHEVVADAVRRFKAKGGVIDDRPPIFEKPKKRRKDMTAQEKQSNPVRQSLTDDTQVYQENEDADN